MDRVRSLFGFSEPVEEEESSAETTAQEVNDLANWYNYPQREQFLFNSEMTEDVSGSSNHVNHLNPTEVQGSEDIMGAETVIFPQFTQNISGQGRTFANTIHPGMVIPNPDNYPTPQSNNPWEPFVDIQTYGDIKNVPFQPYPSAMQWATNPDNYQEYPSTDYAAEDKEFGAYDKDGYYTNAPKNWKGKTYEIRKCEGYSCNQNDYIVRVIGVPSFKAQTNGRFSGQDKNGKYQKTVIVSSTGNASFKKGDDIKLPNQIRMFKTVSQAKRYVNSLNPNFGLRGSKRQFYYKDLTKKRGINALKFWRNWGKK